MLSEEMIVIRSGPHFQNSPGSEFFEEPIGGSYNTAGNLAISHFELYSYARLIKKVDRFFVLVVAGRFYFPPLILFGTLENLAKENLFC